MKASPDRPEARLATRSSSFNLRYPTIPVHGSPSVWLSQSSLVDAPVRMATVRDDISLGDTASSLGDSNYDFIDDRSVGLTDEEDHDRMTESITSSNDNELPHQEAIPPHVAAFAGQDSLPKYHDGSAMDVQTPTKNHLHDTVNQEHVALCKSDLSQDSPTSSIIFEEPSVINLKSTAPREVSYQLREVEITEPQPGRGAHRRRVSVSLRQTMGIRSVDMKDKAYKVFYVGPACFKDPVIQKIGTALAATRETSPSEPPATSRSQFNVVPISAFGDQDPEVVLIDSSGLQLNVDEAAWVVTEERASQTRLLLSDGRVIDSARSEVGGRSKIGDWDIPDIAVFCVSARNDAEARVQSSVMSFLRNHNVKILLITDEVIDVPKACSTETHSDLEFPHLVVESPRGDHPSYCAPVDIETFLSIDASQMNRNLAYSNSLRQTSGLDVTSSGHSEKENSETSDLTSTSLRETLKFITSRLTGSSAALIAMAMLLSSAYLSMFLTRPTLRLPAPAEQNCVAKSSGPPLTVLQNPTSSITTRPWLVSHPILTSSMTTVSKISTPSSLSSGTEIASFLLDAYAKPPQKLERFKVHVLGDCHVVLRPPHWFSKLKKGPPLQFNITRHNLLLDHQVSTLFDGVFALQLPREEAYGLVDVQIWTEAKPFVNETFKIDFRSSWLKADSWKRASRALASSMQRDLVLVQNGLGYFYNQTKTELSTFVQISNNLNSNTTQRGPAASVAKPLQDLALVMTKKLHAGRQEASKQMQALTMDLMVVRRDLVSAVNELRASSDGLVRKPISPLSDLLSRLRKQTSWPVRSTLHGMPRSFSESLTAVKWQYREAQKNLLKTWWRVKGVPRRHDVPPGTLKTHNERRRRIR